LSGEDPSCRFATDGACRLPPGDRIPRNQRSDSAEIGDRIQPKWVIGIRRNTQIARSFGATLATRNVTDFDGCGIELINPWEAEKQ